MNATSLKSSSRLKRSTPLSQEPEWIRQGTFLGNRFHYRHKNPLIHNSLNLSVLSVILAGMLGLCYSGLSLPAFIFLPLGSFGFGLAYFALAILTIHEASHNMFLVFKDAKKSRIWNRRMGQFFCLSFGIDYVNHWEIGHKIHHLHPVEEFDPQNCPNTIYTGRSLWLYCLKVLLVPGYVLVCRRHDDCSAVQSYARNWKLFCNMAVSWSLTIVLLTIYFNWTVALAAVLGTGVLSVLNQFKIAMEHSGDIARRGNPVLRSVSSFFPLRSILMPLNISIHFEHHLNDAVPWYDLLKYHQEFKAIVPPEIQPEIFHYNGQVWQQIVSR